MNSHFKGGLKIPPSKHDKAQFFPFIKGAKSPAPNVACSCEPKKQRTEEDNDSCTSSTKGLASGKKNDAALTVPENAAARALSLCSSAKSTANPFHDVHKKKLTKKDCNEIAFGFWEDEHNKHWCLIELGFPSKGFYEH